MRNHLLVTSQHNPGRRKIDLKDMMHIQIIQIELKAQ